MKKYKVLFAETFLEDLTEITLYILEKSGRADTATRFYSDVLEIVEHRSFGADSYEPYSPYEDSPEYYRIYFGHYVIFYVLYDDIMDIRRILLSNMNAQEKL